MNLRSFSLYRNYSFPPTYFFKCRPTLLELNSKGPYPCLFTSSIKREIRHVHVAVMQKRAKKCPKKSVVHVQTCCFANKTYCFLTFSLPSARLDLKLPNSTGRKLLSTLVLLFVLLLMRCCWYTCFVCVRLALCLRHYEVQH